MNNQMFPDQRRFSNGGSSDTSSPARSTQNSNVNFYTSGDQQQGSQQGTMSPNSVWGNNQLHQRGGAGGIGANPVQGQPAYANDPYAPAPNMKMPQQQQQQQQQQYGGGVNNNLGQSGYASNNMNNMNTGNDMDYSNRHAVYNNSYGSGYDGFNDSEFANEPPLLEELGIRFDFIWLKTLTVLYPSKDIQTLSNVSKLSLKSLTSFFLNKDSTFLNNMNFSASNISGYINNPDFDTDMAGPLIFCLLLGICLLLAGKAHFGYIYGFSVCGVLLLHNLLSLMQVRTVNSNPGGDKDMNVKGNALIVWETASICGYGLLPVIMLSFIGIVLSMRGIFGLVLSVGAITWSTYAVTRLFDNKMRLWHNHQYYLVAYPVALLYACFTLITVF